MSFVNYLIHINRRKWAWYAGLLGIILIAACYTLPFSSEKTSAQPNPITPVLGKDYVLVSSSEIIPPLSPKPLVTVTEFFSYDCAACQSLEQPIEAWLALQPPSVQFEQIPLSDGSPYMNEIMRVHYLAHQLKANMTGTLFKWLDEGQNIQDSEIIKENLMALGVSLTDYERVINQQAGLDAQINRGRNLEKAYRIRETPIFIVGGHYKTSLAMVNGDLSRFFEIIEALIEKVRKGRE